MFTSYFDSYSSHVRRINKKLYDEIEKRFEVIAYIDVFLENLDTDANNLKNILSRFKKESYAPKERIIIQNRDTSFYLGTNFPSITYHNILTLLKELDIPLSNVIFLSNMPTLKQELEHICDYLGMEKDFINTLYTVWMVHYVDTDIIDIDINTNAIIYQYSSLNGEDRSHRAMFVYSLKDKGILNKGLVSFNSRAKGRKK